MTSNLINMQRINIALINNDLIWLCIICSLPAWCLYMTTVTCVSRRIVTPSEPSQWSAIQSCKCKWKTSLSHFGASVEMYFACTICSRWSDMTHVSLPSHHYFNTNPHISSYSSSVPVVHNFVFLRILTYLLNNPWQRNCQFVLERMPQIHILQLTVCTECTVYMHGVT